MTSRTGARLVGVLIGRAPQERYSVHRGYVDALTTLGATPVLLTPGVDRHGRSDPQPVLDALERLDAVLLTGGGDVDPAQYGCADPEGVPLMELDPERDATELAAARWAMESGRRTLGICRGHQVLAVAAGGALVRDLPDAGFEGHWQEDRQYEPVHGLDVTPGSLAGSALGGAELVNSIHHQAVAAAGALRVTARGTDGVVEAVEGDGALANRVLGIQWHPERLLADPRHLAPFRWLVTGSTAA